MSQTTVIAIWPGEKSGYLAELRNAYGHGPAIWSALCNKYLGGSWIMKEKELWPLWRDERLPLHQRAVLGMTYDNVYILKADYARAAADIRKFLADFPTMEGRVNHWPEIAAILESDPDCPAIAFWGTSVCDNPWRGEYNEGTDDYDPIDWSPTWSLYEHLEAKDEGGES